MNKLIALVLLTGCGWEHDSIQLDPGPYSEDNIFQIIDTVFAYADTVSDGWGTEAMETGFELFFSTDISKTCRDNPKVSGCAIVLKGLSQIGKHNVVAIRYNAGRCLNRTSLVHELMHLVLNPHIKSNNDEDQTIQHPWPWYRYREDDPAEKDYTSTAADMVKDIGADDCAE